MPNQTLTLEDIELYRKNPATYKGKTIKNIDDLMDATGNKDISNAIYQFNLIRQTQIKSLKNNRPIIKVI